MQANTLQTTLNGHIVKARVQKTMVDLTIGGHNRRMRHARAVRFFENIRDGEWNPDLRIDYTSDVRRVFSTHFGPSFPRGEARGQLKGRITRFLNNLQTAIADRKIAEGFGF